MEYGTPFEADHPDENLEAEFSFRTATELIYKLLDTDGDVVFQETFSQDEIEVNDLD